MSPGRRGDRSRHSRGRSSSQRVGHGTAAPRYPRTARVNKLLLEVLADSLERMVAGDERLSMLTITAVEADPDFQTATVFFSSLDDTEREALNAARIKLQAEIARQVRLKRTPLLSFAADPAVSSGQRVEDILRTLGPSRLDSAGDEQSERGDEPEEPDEPNETDEAEEPDEPDDEEGTSEDPRGKGPVR